jgi:hypothetical protein
MRRCGLDSSGSEYRPVVDLVITVRKIWFQYNTGNIYGLAEDLLASQGLHSV